ncbi:putative signal transducing protein [Labilibacter marinus]|uniref:putative signal transducing protein n=1 Tax=Labilibacter marinus TaxID=1477105 RepID=UPI0009500210|nr:DUF2007 domain-containing protein [Labilibacter marinus]
MTETELISVFNGSPIDADIIKEILEDHGIMVQVKNELMGSIAPWHVSPGGIDPTEIVVLESDKENALLLIDEFNKSK